MDIYRLPNRFVRIAALFGIAAAPHLDGSVAVPVRYAPLNKMIITVSINGHAANLLVDTGANLTMLDTDTAQLYGVAANQFGGRRYIGYQRINGQLSPIAFIRNLTAGRMNLGNLNVALVDASGRGGFTNSVGNRSEERRVGEECR